VSPILGIIASSKLRAVPNSYESIATTTLGSAQSSITFSSFSGYTHLQVRSLARQTLSSVSYMFFRFNSDSGSNYSYHTVYGDGASAAVDTGTSQTLGVAGLQGGTANIFAGSVLDILDYSNTNKFKTTRVLDGVDVNGAGGYVELTSSCWRSTSAITSIEIFLSGASFATGSTFSIYGIKGV
jgi:hypothetical protein